MSSDLFPFSSSLMEAYNTVSLDGPALALAEVKYLSIACNVACRTRRLNHILFLGSI